MAAEVVAAGLTAAAGIGSNVAQTIANSNLNKKNRAWQEKMYDQQYQRNVELWKLQNAYNTPAEQVKRLRQAGLNPNLLYGNGSAATGNAGEISAADVPSTPTSVPYDFSQASNGLASGLAMYQNWRMNELNMDKVRSQTENINANTIYQQSMRSGQDIKNKLLGVDLSWAWKNYDLDYASKRLGMSKTQTEIFLNNARRRQVELGIFQDAAAFETKLELLRAQTYQAKASALNAFGAFKEAENRLAVGYYGAQASQARSVASLNNQQHDFQSLYYDRGLNVPSGTLMGLPNTFLGLSGKVLQPVGDWIDKGVSKLKSKFKR